MPGCQASFSRSASAPRSKALLLDSAAQAANASEPDIRPGEGQGAWRVLILLSVLWSFGPAFRLMQNLLCDFAVSRAFSSTGDRLLAKALYEHFFYHVL